MSRNAWSFLIAVSLALITFSPCRVSNAAGDNLAEGFANPPSAARPAIYWVWVNGLTEARQRTYELEQLKDKGISSLYIFDVGARDTRGIVPAGPAFMGPESLKAIGHTVKEATRLGLDVGITTSSSWNCGGPWVKLEHASMGLYHVQKVVEGPARIAEVLPFPVVPKQTPKGADGLPKYYKNVAVLAAPEAKRLAGHEFLFELFPAGVQSIDRVVLYNSLSGNLKRRGTTDLFAKDFEVFASTTDTDVASFRRIIAGTLRPNAEPQTFRFGPVKAKYVKLVVLSGHNTKDDKVQLAEFEVYSTQGRNVVSAYHEDGSKTAAGLLHYTSALSPEGDWAAANIHDGSKSGPGGSWCSAGAPQPVIEDIDSIIDLTDSVDENGRLEWDAPPGRWTIMRFVCANTGAPLRLPSPNSGGLAIDHFNAEATRAHFDYMIDLLRKEIGDFKDTALKQMYVCSYELSGSTWTPDFLEQFETRRGYDMTRYLPVLSGSVVKDHETTEKFRYDFRKTLGDLLVDAFYKTAREISNEHGLQLCAEAGGPGPPLHQVPVDALKALGALDIPRGEFWKEHNVWVVKETACASHIYGKRIVDMESFTSWRHWQDGPFELKAIADQALCGGTNHFTFHTSAHNPSATEKPGWVYHAGTHISPSLAWWPKAKPFIDYLSRCSFLLQEGLFVADVCYYYGDQGFNFVPPKHVDPSLGYGYDYDVTNAEVILTRMSVKNGRIVLGDGMSYELLVLPDRDDVDLDVLKKIEKLVKAGATVVGRRPTTAAGLTDHPHRGRQVEELANKVWGPCDGTNVKWRRYGKGEIIQGRTLRDILHGRGIGPDFTFTSDDSDASIDYIHRRTKDADIYFVSNKKMSSAQVYCMFRVFDKVPELWDPVSGRMHKQMLYDSLDDGTRVPLRLSPLGSVFVVFRDKSVKNHIAWIMLSKEAQLPEVLPGKRNDIELQAFENGAYIFNPARGDEMWVGVENIPASVEIKGPWEVRFAEGWGAPESTILPNLISWTEHPDDGIKYFSGMAAYHKEFDLAPNQLSDDRRVFLDLGRLHFVAEVYLNGESLGILWAPPYRIDITDAARPGSNKLVVDVANTWSNRLVGDTKLPEGERFCRTNMTHSLTWEMPWKDTPLLESGLLGPVRLVTAKTVSIDLP